VSTLWECRRTAGGQVYAFLSASHRAAIYQAGRI
jgi:hypothetical protein